MLAKSRHRVKSWRTPDDSPLSSLSMTQKTGEYYGKFRLSSDIVTLNSVVEIDLNFSKLSNVQGSFEPTLPTGEPFLLED